MSHKNVDEWYSPDSCWDYIPHWLDYIQGKTIFEPFFGKGHLVKSFENRNFQVLYDKKLDAYSKQAEDYFKKCDIVITNPPFSSKWRFFDDLIKYDKPFIVLLPMNTLGTQRFREVFGKILDKVSITIPQNFGFVDGEDKQCKPGKFYICFLGYKVDEGGRLYFHSDMTGKYVKSNQKMVITAPRKQTLWSLVWENIDFSCISLI